VRCRSPAGLVLEIDVGQRVAVNVSDDVAILAELGVRVIEGSRRREAAGLRHKKTRPGRA